MVAVFLLPHQLTQPAQLRLILHRTFTFRATSLVRPLERLLSIPLFYYIQQQANFSQISQSSPHYQTSLTMTSTQQPTSYPIQRPYSQAYTTPPNSQGSPQHFLHQPPQQYVPQQSPLDPSQTPTNVSPTSPSQALNYPAFNLPLANRQSRPPKSPMYIPAALRPTERQHRPSPLTPPRSLHGSTDSLDTKDPKRPISRRSTTDSKKKSTLGQQSEAASPTTDVPISTSDLQPVTGPPTRAHWKPDINASICDDPICPKRFGLWERRHHCRHCGNVFCADHSKLQIPLDQEAEFHPEGMLCRACGHCIGQYEKWVEERRERAEMGDEETHSTPVKAVLPRGGSGKVAEGRGSMAQSLTRDWNWSTF